jgi:putative ABC transport system permease protein
VIRLAWQGLWERKVRTVLTLAGVAVCVLALTTVDSMLGYMRIERERDTARFANRILLQPPGAGYPPFRSMLREESVTAALDRPDIIPSQSTPLLFLILSQADNPMDIANVIGLGILPGREQAWLGFIGAASGQATLAGAGEDAVILGPEAARFYGVSSPGETVTFANRQWRVIGILQSTGTNRWDKLVIMPLSSAQAAFGAPGWISALLLTAKPGEAGRLAGALGEAYPKLDVFTQDTIYAVLQTELDLPNKFMGTISWAAFLMAVLIVANIMSVAVRERTEDVEKIRPIGSRRSAILSYTLSEALMLSLGGGLLGALAAVPAAYAFGWTWIISWEEMLRVAGLILASGLMAGVYPAYRAARAYPQALQYDHLQKQMEKVTAEKRAMDQAYRHLVRGREEERERLARELHDQAIQSLVGLKFRLAGQAPAGPMEMQDQVNSVIGSLRDLCSDLRPPALDMLGLAASLRSYVNDFAERTGQPVVFRLCGEERRLAPEVELSLFRVAQEALTNAWKHAQAPTVDMELRFDAAAVRLTVCDRGRGFRIPERLEALTEAGHFGLVGMHERLQLAGGELQLLSRVGEGTTITATVPISTPAK